MKQSVGYYIGMQLAVASKRGWRNIWSATDSEAARGAIVSGNVPWRLRSKLQQATSELQYWKVSCIFRD